MDPVGEEEGEGGAEMEGVGVPLGWDPFSGVPVGKRKGVPVWVGVSVERSGKLAVGDVDAVFPAVREGVEESVAPPAKGEGVKLTLPVPPPPAAAGVALPTEDALPTPEGEAVVEPEGAGEDVAEFG